MGVTARSTHLASTSYASSSTSLCHANNFTGNYFKGRPDGWESLEDRDFVVTLLAETATLEMTAGGNSLPGYAPSLP